MRRTLLAMAAAGLLAVFPAVSQAACSITGTMVRAKMADDSSNGTHTLYLRDRVTDPFFYTAQTTDDDMAALAATLAALQTRVRVRGDASGCPTPPASGGVGIGQVVQILAVP